jgi:hypothetical protein
MKKNILMIAVALCILNAGIARSQTGDNLFVKGSTVAGLGLGLGGTMYGSGYGMKVPPLSLSLEYGLVDNLIKSSGKGSIGVAPTIGYASYGYDFLGDWSLTNLMIGAKGNFHYQFIPKLDTYAGIHIGYNIVKWDTDNDIFDGAAASEIFWAFHVGGRYYFTNNLAVMAELGYGISVLNIGISLKLK